MPSIHKSRVGTQKLARIARSCLQVAGGVVHTKYMKKALYISPGNPHPARTEQRQNMVRREHHRKAGRIMRHKSGSAARYTDMGPGK
jgi:hypothetical protein